jgi:hypothetical protein
VQLILLFYLCLALEPTLRSFQYITLFTTFIYLRVSARQMPFMNIVNNVPSTYKFPLISNGELWGAFASAPWVGPVLMLKGK